MVVVCDASLAVKWYLREAQTFEAFGYLADHSSEIVVPDIFVAEVNGALVRRANIDKTKRIESEAAMMRFAALFAAGVISVVHQAPEDVAKAGAIALDLGHPLKDCLYLALAIDLDCDLMTCDARFAKKARSLSAAVQVLGE